MVVLIPDDTTPPPVPSAPALMSRLGVIHASWDGLGSMGEEMPPDFDRVLVWMRDPAVEGGTQIVDYLQAAGVVVIGDQPYGADREIWFTALDRSGNTSTRSGVMTIATQALVDTDVVGKVISGAKILDGTLVASDAVVANTITGGLVQAAAITAGHLAANSVTTPALAAGSVTAGKLEAVLTLTSRLVAGSSAAARVELSSSGLQAFNAAGVQTVSIANSGSFVLRSATSGARVELDTAGFRAFNSAGTRTVSLSSTGSVDFLGELRSGDSGRRLVVNPRGAVDPEIRFYADNGGSYVRMYGAPTGTSEPELVIVGAAGANGRTPELLMGSGYAFMKNSGAGSAESRIRLDANGDVNIGTGATVFEGKIGVQNSASAICAGKASASGTGGMVFYGTSYDSTPFPAVMVRAGNNAPFNINHVASDGFGWTWGGPSLSGSADHLNWFGRKE
ncbi:hypothetical protein ACFQYP_00420 [Nonomuraea antimicrobica]